MVMYVILAVAAVCSVLVYVALKGDKKKEVKDSANPSPGSGGVVDPLLPPKDEPLPMIFKTSLDYSPEATPTLPENVTVQAPKKRGAPKKKVEPVAKTKSTRSSKK